MKSERPASEPRSAEEPVCPICRDKGWLSPDVPYDHPDFGIPIPCRCQKAQRNQRLMRFCRLPSNTVHMTFDSFVPRPGLEDAVRWAKAMADGERTVGRLTIMGHVDRGKTHLAVAIVRRWIERGVPAKYARVPDMLAELRRGFDPDSPHSYYYEYQRLKDVPLLLLDDLGMEKQSDWALEQLDNLIDHRIVEGLPFIATTNSPMNELPHRLASRLQRKVPNLPAVVLMLKVGEYRLCPEGS